MTYEIRFDISNYALDEKEFREDIEKKIKSFIDNVMDEPDKIGRYTITVFCEAKGSKDYLYIEFYSEDYAELMYTMRWCIAC